MVSSFQDSTIKCCTTVNILNLPLSAAGTLVFKKKHTTSLNFLDENPLPSKNRSPTMYRRGSCTQNSKYSTCVIYIQSWYIFYLFLHFLSCLNSSYISEMIYIYLTHIRTYIKDTIYRTAPLIIMRGLGFKLGFGYEPKRKVKCLKQAHRY